MYTIEAAIEGIAPLLQHRFPMPDLNGGPTKRVTGKIDYTEEWKEYLYATPEGDVYQPAVHIEQAMAKAAGSFKVAGRRGATYRDIVKAALFISPDALIHEGLKKPDALDTDAAKPLYLDVRPVVVQRARVVRIRPCLKAGWDLSFTIEVSDDQLPADVVNDILTHAGRSVGLGDYRPRFGRFMVTQFKVLS